LEAVVGDTVTDVLVTAKPLSGERVSVAVKVHEVPVVIAIPLKVAIAELAVTSDVPVKTQFDVSWIVSAAPGEVAGALVPSSTVTIKFARGLPAVVVEAGSVVKTRWVAAAADAGDTATKARPATARAVVAPIATNDFIRVLKERWPTLRVAEFIIWFPPLHFPSGLNA
jgi:hypothetical protein